MQTCLDNIFAEVNATNIRKSFYKKKDLVVSQAVDQTRKETTKDAENEESKKPAGATASEVIYDSHGEELMEHTSKNTMNEMILANNEKQSKTTLNGKRSRSDAGLGEDPESTNEPSSKRKKTKQASSYAGYL